MRHRRPDTLESGLRFQVHGLYILIVYKLSAIDLPCEQ